MFYGSYTEFEGIDCTLLVEDDNLALVPKTSTSYTKMLSCTAKKSFLYSILGHGKRNCTAYIKEVEFFDNALRLYPIFTTQIFDIKPIHNIEITGTAIQKKKHRWFAFWK